MSYRLATFGTVPLPDSMTADDLSTPQVASTLLDTLGDTVDIYGTARRLPVRQEFSCSGIYHGELEYLVDASGNSLVDDAGNYLITGTAANRLREQVERLRAKQGVRDQLWRSRDDDAALQWRYARLLQVAMRGDVERWAADVAEVEAVFETPHGAWRSATAVQDNRTLTAGVAANQVVAVSGNAPVHDAIITLVATATITSFTVACTAIGATWTWTGSLAVGVGLVIDCGALTVRKAGVDAFSGFALNSGHTARGWLPLAVGNNTLILTANAGGLCYIDHYDQWW